MCFDWAISQLSFDAGPSSGILDDGSGSRGTSVHASRNFDSKAAV